MTNLATSGQRPALPTWARVIDILTVSLLIAGLVVAAFGGIRVRAIGLRLALTSPARLFFWAIAVGVVRHVLIRQDPIYRRIVASFGQAIQSMAFRVAWPVFVGTRLPTLLVGYFAVMLIGYPIAQPPNRVSANEFVNLPSRWDTGWYLDIAVYGYKWNPAPGLREQQNIAFFPAYPLLMRVVGRILGDNPLAAGVVIAFAAFFVGLIYLYGLARQWLDGEQSATALWLLASYPFALFFSAAYTEALYLCGAVAAFYCFHRGAFLKAGAWGLLVGLTRPNGFFLSVPLAILAAAQLAPPGDRWTRLIYGEYRSEEDADLRSRRRVAAAFVAATMPVVGMLLFSAFIYSLTGNPFTWARAHLAWGREYSGIASLFADRYRYIADQGFYDYTASLPLDVFNLMSMLFVLSMSGLVFKRFGLTYVSFLLLNLIPPVVAGGLLSVGRFTCVLFPAFLALAPTVSVRARPGWVAAFAMGQALNASLFFTWRPLF